MNASRDTPVGVWSGTVSHDDQVDAFVIVFVEGGGIAMVTPVSTGEGSWSGEGSGKFVYRVRETFREGAGPDGYVLIEVRAECTDRTYTGSGNASLHAPDGRVVGSMTCQVSADYRSLDGPTGMLEWQTLLALAGAAESAERHG